nr:uncharacterized protein LOC117227633 isoform X1 [Megalopta genalis]
MASALLGKCIGLLVPVLLLLLAYSSCYGFRIREQSSQMASNSAMVQESSQHHRATCVSGSGSDSAIFPRCQDRTSTAFAARKWHEAAASRILARRKPPVEVTSVEDDEEGTPVRHERMARSPVGVVDHRVAERENSEDDDDEAVVEVVDSEEIIVDSVDREHDTESEGNDEEDDDEDGGQSVRKKWKPNVSSRRDRSTEESGFRNKEARPFKELKKSYDGDEDEDDGKSNVRLPKRPGADQAENEQETDEESESKEADEEDEETGEEEEEEVVTAPPAKLEKARYADKDKVKSVESPSTMKPKVETRPPAGKREEPRKVEAIKKQADISKKPTETPAKSLETPKKAEPIKVTKPDVESLKPKTTPKPEIKEKVPAEVPTPREKAREDGGKDRVPVRPEEKQKQPVKVKPKAQPPQPAKKKVETTVSPKVAPPKPAKIKRLDKDDPIEKTKVRADAAFTLPELNDMLLRVPTFVPNFTAMEDFECQQHGKIFLRQLRGRKLWALQMLDSSAKIPSGLLRGNVNQLGDFDECMGVMAHVKLNNATIKVQGKYCLANIDFYADDPDMRLPTNLMHGRSTFRGSMRDPGHFVPRGTTANWALCIPAACSVEHAKNIVEQALEFYNSTIGIKFIVHVDPNMCYVKQKSESYSKETIGVLYFYAMIICLAIVATARDYLVVSEGKGKRIFTCNAAVDSDLILSSGSYSERIIMAFSLRKNLKTLLKRGTNSFDISCIHGLRAIGALLIYTAHKFVPLLTMPYVNRLDVSQVVTKPISTIVRTSFIYTEWFLLFSGALTAYNMANEYTKRGEIRWFCRLVTRYIRLTPALLAVIFFYAFVMEHIGSGPLWNITVVRNAEICKSNAWTNLLYIQNFLPMEETCATHTHQLALDMQLSLLAPLLVFLLQFKTIFGVLLIFFFVLLAATLRYVAISTHRLTLVFFHGVSIKQLYRTADLTYTTTLHRATSYVFGVGLGVLLHYTKRDIRIHKVLVVLGWLISAALMSWSILSPWHLAKMDYVYDAEEAANYGVLSPIASSIALCWSIYACHTNNGGIINRFLSQQWLLLISRISYAFYMTQFAVFFINVGSTRYASEFSVFNGLDCKELATVVIVSVVLTLLLDLPMQEFKNVIMECTDMRAKVSVEDQPPETQVKEKPKQQDEEDEVVSTSWDWLKNGTKPSNEPLQEKEKEYKETLKRTPFQSENESLEASRRYSTRDDGYRERRRSKSSQRDYQNSEPEEEELLRSQLEHKDALLQRRRSTSRSLDSRMLQDSDEDEQYLWRQTQREEPRHYSRSESRRRSAIRDREDYRSSESANRDRSSSRGADVKRHSGRSEDLDPVQRQTRSFSRSSDVRRAYSSESEEELSQRRKLEKRQLPAEPRHSDEEDWENELRIRRKQFMERLATQERDSLLEDEDLVSLRRRSSAEGRLALLKDPSADDNMDSWTVSVGSRVAHLGSSQERSEAEEDSAYRRRREYREQAPPPRDDTMSEEEVLWDASRRSHTSSSQMTSVEEDEDVATFNFVLTKDSKRISVQDLSKLSQEEVDLSESGWNIVDKSSELQPKGLYKRESIIKSQASEEDPEYLLPERPKLVQQDNEHPFKKAWQMQKSRSEEDRPYAVGVKEVRDQAKTDPKGPKGDDTPSIQRERSGEQSSEYEDVSSYGDDESESVRLSRSKSTDTEENKTSSTKSEETTSTEGRSRESSKTNSRSDNEEDSSKINWSTEEEHFGVDRTTARSKSEETNWVWEEEET